MARLLELKVRRLNDELWMRRIAFVAGVATWAGVTVVAIATFDRLSALLTIAVQLFVALRAFTRS